MADTAEPPAESKVIVYWFIVHWAVWVLLAAGIVGGRAGLQPLNVYPSFVGAAGAVTAVP